MGGSYTRVGVRIYQSGSGDGGQIYQIVVILPDSDGAHDPTEPRNQIVVRPNGTSL